MDLNTGELVRYIFPESKAGGLMELTGEIMNVNEIGSVIVSGNNVKLKASRFNYIVSFNKKP